mgnify:FL=1
MGRGLAGAVNSFFGIDGLSQDAMKALKLGGAGLGALLLSQELVEKRIPWVKDQNKAVRGGVLAASGLGLSILAAKYVDEDVAAGIAASMIGFGGLRLAQHFLPDFLAPVAGLGAEQNYLDVPGLRNIDISQASRIPGALDGVHVGPRSMVPGAVDGIGHGSAGFGFMVEAQPEPLGSFLS